MNKIEISTIIRTTGSNLFLLERSILSIINNNYQEIEIILIYQGEDNFIKNDILKIISLYENSINFQFIQNNTHQDQRAKNLNLGLEQAKGKYISFLDDDDLISDNYYSKMLSILKQNDDLFAICNVNLIIFERTIENIVRKSIFNKIMNHNFQLEFLLYHNMIPIHSYVFNIQKMKEKNIYPRFNEDLILYEDYFFLLENFLNNNLKPIIIDDVLCDYFIDQNKFLNPYKNQALKSILKSEIYILHFILHNFYKKLSFFLFIKIILYKILHLFYALMKKFL